MFIPNDEEFGTKARAFDGLSFATWSSASSLIEAGDDLNVSNNMRQLEDF